jgi:hypothetical protein
VPISIRLCVSQRRNAVIDVQNVYKGEESVIEGNKVTVVTTMLILTMSGGSMSFSAQLHVGPGQAYTSPSSVASIVKDGDTVEIDSGSYTNETATWRANNLTLRGKARFAHLIAPSVISNGKAIWVVQGNNTIIENIEFSNASVPDQNGAGIRIEGGNITLQNCFFHDNEDGILGGSGPNCNVVIENCEFSRNGFGDGYSHNLYIGNAASLTFRFSYTHHAKIGHTLKSRALKNFILYNRIMDEATGTASYEIDLPNGGTSYIIGNLIQQGPATDNPTIICYGEEGLSNGGTDLYVVNNTIVNDRTSGTFISIASGAFKAKIVNNLFVGSTTGISGPVDTVANVITANPAFVNRTLYDYHPTSSTPGIDKGVDPGSGAGYVLTPAYQYVYDCSGLSRPQRGSMDIGAFEFQAGAVRGAPKSRHLSTAAIRTEFFVDLLGRNARESEKNASQFGPRLIITSARGRSGRPIIFP